MFESLKAIISKADADYTEIYWLRTTPRGKDFRFTFIVRNYGGGKVLSKSLPQMAR